MKKKRCVECGHVLKRQREGLKGNIYLRPETGRYRVRLQGRTVGNFANKRDAEFACTIAVEHYREHGIVMRIKEKIFTIVETPTTCEKESHT